MTAIQKWVDTLKGRTRRSEEGNVLFLILIAVALFAALSYAVTSSSRSGGGDAASETNLVNSAQITQYPSSVRTAIIRMFVTLGVDQEDLNFNPPSGFSTAPCNATNTAKECVFHPTGGGATYVYAPAEVMEDGAQGEWFYSASFAIDQIGVTANNDFIAFLPGVKKSICRKINEELGITFTGAQDSDSDGVPQGITQAIDETRNYDTFGTTTITAIPPVVATITGAFSGQPFGCYDSSASSDAADQNIYYHVLVER